MSKTAISGVPWSRWLLVLGGLHVLLHVLTNGTYGMFRDEFYYLACADHLAWGYVDHPPLSIALLAASRTVLGDSVHAIRVLPAFAGGCLVVLTGLMARELGGGRFAQLLAALCMAIAPSYLATTGLYSMNAFDLLLWAVSFLLVIRIVKTGNPRLWVFLGAVVGLGLLNKISMLVFGFGLLCGLVLTSHRRQLLSRHVWIAAIIASLLFLPHLLWQVENGWPTLEFMSNAKRYKIAVATPLQFFLGQVLEIHPLNAWLWLVGLCSLLLGRNRRYRIVGIIYVAAFVAFAAQKSKVYYLAPAYPPLLAAGACAIDTFARRRWWGWTRPVVASVIALGGIATIPMGLPVLPVERLLGYQEALGLRASQAETSTVGALDQHFADRFGWQNMTATVTSVFKTLSPEQQADCVILTGNYGEAGAITYYGRQYGLPPAVSGHNNYYLWGPGEASGRTVIAVGVSGQRLTEFFENVTVGATVVSPHAMPYETNIPVYVCTDPRVPLEEAWHHTKLFI
jgi:4-amino-4-deoxy-L-arabinose transferase-like glycosyltransferase